MNNNTISTGQENEQEQEIKTLLILTKKEHSASQPKARFYFNRIKQSELDSKKREFARAKEELNNIKKELKEIKGKKFIKEDYNIYLNQSQEWAKERGLKIVMHTKEKSVSSVRPCNKKHLILK
jgi:hypothetical protein